MTIRIRCYREQDIGYVQLLACTSSPAAWRILVASEDLPVLSGKSRQTAVPKMMKTELTGLFLREGVVRACDVQKYVVFNAA